MAGKPATGASVLLPRNGSSENEPAGDTEKRDDGDGDQQQRRRLVAGLVGRVLFGIFIFHAGMKRLPRSLFLICGVIGGET